jgi:hypothetical protein
MRRRVAVISNHVAAFLEIDSIFANYLVVT